MRGPERSKWRWVAVDNPEVVVVGAGLAGLAAAVQLQDAGVAVCLLEKSEQPGGRVRTDIHDGLRLDRGFQLLNPAYPAAARLLDLEALQLRSFAPGVAVRLDGRLHALGDPLRWPASLPGTLRAPVGSWREKLAVVCWAAQVGYGPARRIKSGPDQPLAELLHRRGLDRRLGAAVLQPFLAGVLADAELSGSRRVAELFVRAFVRGTPSLPAHGMQALGDQLAARLAPGALHTGTRVSAVTGSTVHTDDGRMSARVVLVSCDPVGAAGLCGLPAPQMKALTTYYFHSEQAPTASRLLHLDGDRIGPVINTAVVSNIASSYSDSGALIACTVLGEHGDALMPQVRAAAGRIYGVGSGDWKHAATYPIPEALPAMPAGQPLRQPVDLGDGLFVAGDHRDTPSLQGALVSGTRAAHAITAYLHR